MRVIVACEESQALCIAFRNAGHEAYSCDLKPCSGGHPQWHIVGDVRAALKGGWFVTQSGDIVSVTKWDMLIAHPTCTRLCNSGVLRLYHDGKKVNGIHPDKWQEMEQAAEFFNLFRDADIEKKCIENPVPHGYAMERIGVKYSQIIQPYQFGDDASKATCLWLTGLRLLLPTSYCQPRIVDGKKRWSNQTDSGQNKLPPSDNRAELRSKTYSGIAKAMATQWSDNFVSIQSELF